MRVFKHLFEHPVAIALVVVLLLVQAFCDLALPTYTGDIVDVGILQGGIEHPSLMQMTPMTYENISHALSDGDLATFQESYDLAEDGTYVINDRGSDARDELDAIESQPMADLYDRSMASENPTSSDTQPAADAADTSSDPSAQAEAGTLGGSDALVTQKAISYARAEYDRLGLDAGSIQMDYLWRTGGKMIFFTLLMVVVSIIIGYISSKTSAKIGQSLRHRLFTKVVSFSREQINHFQTASLITRSTNDIQQVQMVSFMLMRMVIYSPILGIGGIIMVARTDVSMSWTIVLAVVVVIAIVILLFSLVLPKFKIMQKLVDRVNLVMREMLTNMSVIRAFGRETHEERRFEDASRDLMETQLFTNRAMSFMQPAMILVMNGVSVLIVWVAAGQVDAGVMQVGDMIAFITYATLIIMSFLIISMVSIMLPRANISAARIDEVLEMETTILEPDDPVNMEQVESELDTQGGTVVFDHVDFRYRDAEEDALHDITFTARPGTMTAIVGSTGCGKSTLINLIPRFYDVTGGSISIDGVDIRRMRLHDLHALLGYVPQKGVLFSGTIASNIKFGAKPITDEDMRRAARISQAEDFILEREMGYDDPISQSGSNVSGGQRQRLSIARALATRAPILLLDDSFSALDFATDRKLRHALGEEASDANIIVVAQRISTVMGADQIVVLDEGRMVGCGTHADLMETCETYREIARSQLSAEELEGSAT